MGADIHMTVERQVHDKWVCVNTLSSHHNRWGDRDSAMNSFSSPIAEARNYKRFAALAGVRGDGPEPRGIPDDVSETTRVLIDDWGADGHSHSWLPLEEAVKIFIETEWTGEDDSPPDPEAYWVKCASSFFFDVDQDDLDEHEFRIVFWFDN